MHVRKKIILAVLVLLMAIAFGMTAVADDPQPACRPGVPACTTPTSPMTSQCMPDGPCAIRK